MIKIKIILALMIAMVGSASVGASLTLTEAKKQDLYTQAKLFFRQGNEIVSQDKMAAKKLYMMAIMRFERIVRDGGVQNGKLYYNIGNTHFLMGNLGQAILNYRRAEQYIPNDSNLRQNLKFALDKRKNKIEEKPQTKVIETLLFLYYKVPSQIRFIIFIICFSIFWIIMSLRLFSRRIAPGWLLICFGLFSAIAFSSLLFDISMKRSNRNGVIIAETVIARKGDGKSYQPSFKTPLNAGAEFKLIENRNEWYQIELYDGRNCWIPKKAAGLI